jgi:type IV pilus assembly protein PilX
MKSASNLSRSNERGMVLVVGLVMVLLIAIVSLSAIRGTGLQEGMAGNMRDRNIAFQAAESALRQGESVVMQAKLPLFNGKNGLHLDLDKTPTNSVTKFTETKWVDEANWVAKVTDDLTWVASEPTYLVEELNSDIGKEAAISGSGTDQESLSFETVPYRASARGVGTTSDTVVILQSYLKRIPD